MTSTLTTPSRSYSDETCRYCQRYQRACGRHTATAPETGAPTYAVFAKSGFTGYVLVVRDWTPEQSTSEPFDVAHALGVSQVIAADIVAADDLANWIEPGTGQDLGEHVADRDGVHAKSCQRAGAVLDAYLRTGSGDLWDRPTTLADMLADLIHLMGADRVRECLARGERYAAMDLEV